MNNNKTITISDTVDALNTNIQVAMTSTEDDNSYRSKQLTYNVLTRTYLLRLCVIPKSDKETWERFIKLKDAGNVIKVIAQYNKINIGDGNLTRNK